MRLDELAWARLVAPALIAVCVLSAGLVALALRFAPDSPVLLVSMAAGPSRCNSSDLILIDIERDQASVITPDLCGLNFGAAWSPDGRRIAYTSTRGASIHLYISDNGGGNMRQITQPRGAILQFSTPSWSPDSRHVIYAEQATSYWRILRYDLDSGETAAITEDERVAASRLRLSPDGRYALPSGGVDGLLLVAVEGGTIRTVVPAVAVSDAVWSPDGAMIAYEAGNRPRQDIFITGVDADDEPRNISRSNFVDTLPRWSPDGERVAFVSVRGGDWHLYRYDLATDEAERLTDLPLALPQGFAWSPDGRQIVFASGLALYRVDVASGDVRRISTPSGFRLSDTYTRLEFRP